MRKTLIRLYSGAKIFPDQNFIVDDLPQYLATLSARNFVYNYVKFDETLSIVLDESFDDLEFSIDSINYASLYHYDEGQDYAPVYYFVTGKEFTSTGACRLYLRIDSLNSFKFGIDYVVGERTRVLREHKKRFTRYHEDVTFTSVSTDYVSGEYRAVINIKKDYPIDVDAIVIKATDIGEISNWSAAHVGQSDRDARITIATPAQVDGKYITFDISSALMKVIDYPSEGLTPILYKKSSRALGEVNAPFYLVYKTRSTEENAAVDCFLTADIPLTVRAYSSKTLGAVNLTDNTFYAFSTRNNDDIPFSLKFPDGGVSYADTALLFPWGTVVRSFVVWKSGNDLHLQYILQDEVTGGNILHVEYEGDYAGVEVFINNTFLNYATSETSANDAAVRAWQGVKDDRFNFSGVTEQTNASLSSIDRTDPKLVKIIKLPYAPTDVTYDNGVVVFGREWEYSAVENLVRVVDVTAPFKHVIKNVENPLNLFVSGETPTDGEARIPLHDPKLLHSDFYVSKFVYDSFAIPLKGEKANPLTAAALVNVDFFPTSTINSKFAFILPFYRGENNVFPEEDFEGVLAVARNNELTLYSSAYLNYIRTGYNYDVKAKERQKVVTGVTAGASVVGSVAGVAVGIATENPAIIGMSVAAGIGILSTLTNSINSIAQSEDTLNKRLVQLHEQSATVAGSDDVDLLDAYRGNVAYINAYECSPRIKKAIDDLFYYCGYTTDEMKVPNLNTRKDFNFVQCNLHIVESKNIPAAMLDDIRRRFADGVTIIHHFVNSWDFEQVLENWEA